MSIQLKKDLILKYIGWFIVSFFVFFQFLIQTSSSLMQQDWLQYFHLNALSVSYLSASFFYTYLLFQIPVGLIYDRFNAKIILMVASFCLGIGCIMFSFSSTIPMAIFSRMMMGASAAFGFIGMLKVNSNLFPGRQFSIMMGLSEAFAAIAMTGAIILVAWLLLHFSWQQVTLQFSAIVFMITALVIIFIPSKKPTDIAAFGLQNLFNNIAKACKNRVVIVSGIYGFFLFSIINAFSSLWGVAFLTIAYPVNKLEAARMMSNIFLGLCVGCPLYGYLSKKFANEITAMKISAVLCAAAIFAIIYLKIPIIILSPLFFIIGILCSVYIQCFAIVGQTVSSDIQATSMSVTNMLIMASAPILQVLIGVILRNNSFGFAHTNVMNYQIALSILPIGMLIAFGLCFFIRLENKT